MTHRRKHGGQEGLFGMLAEARIHDHFEFLEAKEISMITTRFLLLFCLSLSLVGSALSQDSAPAQDDSQCIFGDSFPGAEAPATVKLKQAFFYREKSPRHKDCPAAQGCRTSAYLVQGNQVLVLFSRHGWTCTFYREDTQHKAHLGWIKADLLQTIEPKKLPFESWLGTWDSAKDSFEGIVASIEINRAQKSGFLKVKGDATWLNGEQSTNGSFEVEGRPKGNAFLHRQKAFGESGNRGEQCELKLELMGKYLIGN